MEKFEDNVTCQWCVVMWASVRRQDNCMLIGI